MTTVLGPGLGVAHPRLEVVPSVCLNRAWAGEGKEMEGMDGEGSLC